MDRFEGLVQVLSVSLPSLDKVPDIDKAKDLAKCAYDEMAELVNKYPERFVAAVASLPLADIDASLEEIDRTINAIDQMDISETEKRQIFEDNARKVLRLPI
jgi:predicted TIM-barrel fold metal-dependent hydrolase